MNKKNFIFAILTTIILIAILLICFIFKENKEEISYNNETNTITNTIKENKVEEMSTKIYIKINNLALDVELENNLATKSLIEKLKNEDITILAHEYGGFEKVGDLGFSLPREDTNVKTSAGDIVLYKGNQISLFYNSNSWSYTKLGKIQNVSSNQLKDILGSGDVTLIFSLFK